MTDAAVAAPVAAPETTASTTPPVTAPTTGVDGQPAPAIAEPVASPVDKSLIGIESKATEAKDGDKAEAKVPEEKPVEYNFKLPEGAQEDPELMGQFKELAKDGKLTSEQAQKIVDLAPKIGERIAQANQQRWNEMITDWQGKVRSDPEIGGTKYDATFASISKAIDNYAPKEKEALLNAFRLTGAGSEPNIVKFIARLSNQVGEPNYVPGSGANPAKKSGAEILYPTMNKSTS